MTKHTNAADVELLAELGLDAASPPPAPHSPREERIIAGFEEIERFVEEHHKLPQHGEDRDIFERLYAVRLDRLRESAECRELLQPLDSRGLLAGDFGDRFPNENLDDEALLAELGVGVGAENDVTHLAHVRSRQEIKAAEEIAQRSPCKDFKPFKLLFKQVQQDLNTRVRQTLKYQDNAAVNKGDLFILDGQKVLVADLGEQFISDYGRPNCELRVIYDNGTESNLLLRSLQRALNKDKTSRRIITPDLGPLFSQTEAADDVQTGYIYVLRSQSNDPVIAENRSLIHKIGVTSGEVKKRIANAKKDPTYLLAAVEVVATFKLANIKPGKLEGLLHKFFDSVRLNVKLQDRFCTDVEPREWFFVPLSAIEEAIEKLRASTLHQFQYDPETASIIPNPKSFNS